MASSIHVRDASSDDVAIIAEFNSRLAEESEHKRLDPNVIQRGVARGMARPEQCRYFLAEIDGQVIGQTMITFEWTDWRDGILYWLQSVFVRPEYRGQGVFRALFDHVMQTAKADPDARGMRLYVERENTAALATYGRLGMQPSGHLLYEIDWSGAVRDK
nr:GNAT family N-acetyltransferase [Planctomycetota bacterium]